MLLGEAGVGKTTVARAAASRLAEEGGKVAWVAATEATRTVPFGAMAPYLAEMLTDDVGSLSSAVDGLTALRLFLRAAECLSGYDVLAVDDAHLLEDGSAALVHQLAAGGRLKVLVTVREGVGVSDAVERLWRDGYVSEIRLAPLDLEGVREVLEGRLGAPVDVITAERLRCWSGGNPLLLRELVHAGLASNQLRRVGTSWRWTGERQPARNVGEVVRARFRDVDSDELTALRLTALAEPVSEEVVASVVGVECVDGVCRRGLLVEEGRGDGTVLRLPHPLHGEVLRADLSTALARRLRLQLAAALSGAADPASRLRLACLRLDAGDLPADDELLSAAEYAADLLDARLAERLAMGVRIRSTRRCVVLADALIGQARCAEAEDLLAAHLLADCPASEWLTVTLLRARNLALGLAQFDRSLALVEEAMLRAGPLPPLFAAQAMTLSFLGRYADATEAFDRAGKSGVGVGQLPASAVAGAGAGLVCLGRFGEGLELVREALSVHTDPVDQLALRIVEAGALLYQGDLDGAEASAGTLRAWGLRTQWPGALAYGATISGLATAYRGRYRAAARQLADAVAAVGEYDQFGGLCWHLMSLAMCQAAVGEHSAALLTAEASKQARRDHGGISMNLEVDRLGEAFVLACAGRLTLAVRHLRELVTHCQRAQVSGIGIAALHLYARLGHASTASRRLGRFTVPDCVASRVHVAHIQALADGSPDELLEVSAEFQRLGYWHLAAEAAAVAAERLAPTSTRRAGRAAALRDQQLDRCDVGPLPWWPGAGTSTLTPREGEIAAYAAAGLSNRAIAERMTLSVRTVENQLMRVYTKLGVNGRGDLAERLHPADRYS